MHDECYIVLGGLVTLSLLVINYSYFTRKEQ